MHNISTYGRGERYPRSCSGNAHFALRIILSHAKIFDHNMYFGFPMNPVQTRQMLNNNIPYLKAFVKVQIWASASSYTLICPLVTPLYCFSKRAIQSVLEGFMRVYVLFTFMF